MTSGVRDIVRVGHFTTIDASLYFLLRTELEEAMRSGYQIVGLSSPGPWVSELEALGIQHVPVPNMTRSWSLRSDVRAARDLFKTLRGLHLDVLHTHTPKAGVLGRLVGRLCRVPIIVNTCHGLPMTDHDRRLKRAAVQVIEGLASQFSDAELFLNSDDFVTMQRWLRSGQGAVIGNGTDLQRFAFNAQGRERVRSELRVRPGEVLVGAVGRRVAEKGLHEFADAARTLRERARFVWIGPNDPEKSDAIQGSLEGVQFLGERLDMPELYSAMDLFVLPSYREGLPRSAMEAAACGRPLVLTDIRGSREIGRHEHEAIFVPARDSGALTQQIARLISDPELRSTLGAAAYHRAQARFDQRAMARISFSTYAQVANRKWNRATSDSTSLTNDTTRG